jgi:hypothetical protein
MALSFRVRANARRVCMIGDPERNTPAVATAVAAARRRPRDALRREAV